MFDQNLLRRIIKITTLFVWLCLIAVVNTNILAKPVIDLPCTYIQSKKERI